MKFLDDFNFIDMPLSYQFGYLIYGIFLISSLYIYVEYYHYKLDLCADELENFNPFYFSMINLINIFYYTDINIFNDMKIIMNNHSLYEFFLKYFLKTKFLNKIIIFCGVDYMHESSNFINFILKEPTFNQFCEYNISKECFIKIINAVIKFDYK